MKVYIRLEDGSEGPLLANNYTRIVHGGRGSYVEIDPSQIIKSEVMIAPGEEYRFDESWRNKVYYFWYVTKTGNRKVYYQLKTVSYADYIIGMVYVSPDDVILR